jgi:thymidylate synthase
LVLSQQRESVLDFQYDDFQLLDYDPHPHIAGAVAV